MEKKYKEKYSKREQEQLIAMWTGGRLTDPREYDREEEALIRLRNRLRGNDTFLY